MKKIFIIAEISANHNQKFDQAVKLIRSAKDSGADAVKFQTYTADTLTIDVNNKFFKRSYPDCNIRTLYELYKKGCTPWSWFRKLKKVCKELNIIFFSTAFDKTAVDFLEEIDVPFHKIASFELIDLPLIEYVAKTGKPVIMSTGMASLSEIKEAVQTARNAGAREITLLKCVSSYPAKPEDMNLRTIPHMRDLFNCRVGLSDHTQGIGASVASISLGAEMIEKHFTLSRKIKTLDSSFSLEPVEFKELVRNVRIAQKALGRVRYGQTAEEKKKSISRRSLFAVRDVKKGDVFTDENVRSIRPADGLKPKYLGTVLGKKAKRNIRKGTPLDWDLVAAGNKRIT